MKLRMTTPTGMIVNREVSYVQAEDETGRFGVLPGHERMLTSLVPSIVLYRYKDEEGNEMEKYAAVRSGICRVRQNLVYIAVRQAHLSDTVKELESEIRSTRKKQAGHAYALTRSLYQMQISALRRLMEYEHVGAQ